MPAAVEIGKCKVGKHLAGRGIEPRVVCRRAFLDHDFAGLHVHRLHREVARAGAKDRNLARGVYRLADRRLKFAVEIRIHRPALVGGIHHAVCRLGRKHHAQSPAFHVDGADEEDVEVINERRDRRRGRRWRGRRVGRSGPAAHRFRRPFEADRKLAVDAVVPGEREANRLRISGERPALPGAEFAVAIAIEPEGFVATASGIHGHEERLALDHKWTTKRPNAIIGTGRRWQRGDGLGGSGHNRRERPRARFDGGIQLPPKLGGGERRQHPAGNGREPDETQGTVR